MTAPIVEVDGVEIEHVTSVRVTALEPIHPDASTFINPWLTVPAIAGWEYELETATNTTIGRLRSPLTIRTETRHGAQVDVYELWVRLESPQSIAERQHARNVASFARLCSTWRSWSLAQRFGAHKWVRADGLMPDPHSSNVVCAECGAVRCVICDPDWELSLDCWDGHTLRALTASVRFDRAAVSAMMQQAIAAGLPVEVAAELVGLADRSGATMTALIALIES